MMRNTASANMKSLVTRGPGLRSFVRFAVLLPVIFSLLVFSSNVVREDSSSPVSAATATIFSVQNGNWTNGATWNLGRVPGPGEWVAVSQGDTVIYDNYSDTVYGEVDVEGVLRFSRTVNTRLRVNDNIFVLDQGFLDMGTEADPIPRDVNAEVIFVLPQGKAYVGGPQFEPGDTGLWVFSGGRWETHGQYIARTWAKLGQDAAAGASMVVADDNVSDWYIGGSVVITQTTNPLPLTSENIVLENEIRVITALNSLPNGTTEVHLNTPLSNFHHGSGQERGEVALLTRNILITTDLIGINESDLETFSQGDRDQRHFAHTMFMRGSDGNVKYTEFKYMGSVRALARYPVHYHLMLDTSVGSTITGNGVWYSGNRAYVVHESDGITIEDNVSYNTISSSYFVELTKISTPDCAIQSSLVTAPPKDNIFLRNIGVEAAPVSSWNLLSGSPADSSIFWLDQWLYQSMIGNVAVGAHAVSGPLVERSAGFQMDETCQVVDATRPNDNPWFDNEAHSNRQSGLLTWCGGCPPRDLVGFHLWKNGEMGFWWASYVNPMRLYNSRFVENGWRQILFWSIRTHTQDSEFIGGGSDWTDYMPSVQNEGLSAVAYVANPSPDWPSRVVRSSFSGDQVHWFQNHQVCAEPLTEFEEVGFKGCTPNYFDFFGSSFDGPQDPFDFGWHQNANSMTRVFDYSGRASYPSDFAITRDDSINPVQQTQITTNFVNGSTTFDAQSGGNITPMSSLASQIGPMSLKDTQGTPYQYTFDQAVDYPPTVSISVNMSGGLATLNANALDDKGVTSVQFYLNGALIGEDSSAPYGLNLDLLPYKGKFAFVHAVAFDGYIYPLALPGETGTKQLAYSNVVQINPEAIHGGSSQGNTGPSNLAPFVSAGVDQSITLPSSVTLDGTVTDDALPSASVTTTWSMVSGPGTATFASTGAIDTTASFSASGAYVLRLTADDGALTTSDDVNVNVNPVQVVSTPTMTTSAGQVAVGGMAPVQIILSNAPDGVAGYTFKLAVANGSLARISNIQVGNGFSVMDPTQNSLTDSLATFSAVDATDVVRSGDTNIVLATVNIEALAEGTTTLNLTVVALDDDSGQLISVVASDGSFTGLNAAPVVAASPKTVSISEGATFVGSASISDLGDLQWNVTVNYGDGSTPASMPNNGASVALSHSYTKAGSYTITATATDSTGVSASDTIIVTVTLACPTLPGLSLPALDNNGDGLCEDLNGNGRLDFDDVAEFFEHLSSVEIQSNPLKFDFNGSGAVDMDDIVQLFAVLLS